MTIQNLFNIETFTSFLVKKLIPCQKLLFIYVFSLNVRFVSQIYTVQPYFQPNFVVSAKIRLIRISAKKFVQSAELKKIRLRGLITAHCQR